MASTSLELDILWVWYSSNIIADSTPRVSATSLEKEIFSELFNVLQASPFFYSIAKFF